jgi:hypothetical protein
MNGVNMDLRVATIKHLNTGIYKAQICDKSTVTPTQSLGVGGYGSVEKVCLPHDTQTPPTCFALKTILVPQEAALYNQKQELYFWDSSSNAEVRIGQLLTQLMLNGNTPHINGYAKDYICGQNHVITLEYADKNNLFTYIK